MKSSGKREFAVVNIASIISFNPGSILAYSAGKATIAWP